MSTAIPTRDGADTAAVRQAIATTARPPRPGPLSTALTFGWRGMLKVKHVPEQLLDVTVTSSSCSGTCLTFSMPRQPKVSACASRPGRGGRAVVAMA